MLCFAFFNLCNYCKGQNIASPTDNVKKYNPVKIGEKCPDFEMREIINWKKKNAKLSEFKGKWLILDFWFTNCQPCIAMFPKTKQLEESFKDHIQFMPVTWNSETEVKTLFKKMNKGMGVTYPSVINEKGSMEINSLFPHSSEPFYVWIDPNGILRGATGPEMVTEEVISAVINGDLSKLKRRQESNVNTIFKEGRLFVPKKLLIGDSGRLGNKVVYKSVLLNYVQGIKGLANFSRFDTVYFIHSSIPGLFRAAFSERSVDYEYPYSRTILEVQNPAEYLFPLNGSTVDFQKWAHGHVYSYNLTLPASFAHQYNPEEFSKLMSGQLQPSEDFFRKKAAVCRIMREDFERIFPLTAKLEMRKISCLVLYCNDTSLLVSKGGVRTVQSDKMISYLKIKNGTMFDLISRLESGPLFEIPIVNETGYQGFLDIEIKAKMNNVDEINNSIKQYGLKFIKAERELEVLVLKEKYRKY